jgi:hypothetical protein
VLGLNLHFEGVTLETLAGARELRELGLDPYYFVLHVSIDNADSGHTAMVVHTVVKYLAHVRRCSRSSSRCRGSHFADGIEINDSGDEEENDDADDDDDEDATAKAAVQQAWKRIQAGYILSAGLPTSPCTAALREQSAGAVHTHITDAAVPAAAATCAAVADSP